MSGYAQGFQGVYPYYVLSGYAFWTLPRLKAMGLAKQRFRRKGIFIEKGPFSTDKGASQVPLRSKRFAAGRWTSLLGKRNHTPPCSSAELFFAEKNGVHRGKISVVDMAFLVFIGFLYPPPAWKVFFEASKFSKRFSFGGGSVRFVLLCHCLSLSSKDLTTMTSNEVHRPAAKRLIGD